MNRIEKETNYPYCFRGGGNKTFTNNFLYNLNNKKCVLI